MLYQPRADWAIVALSLTAAALLLAERLDEGHDCRASQSEVGLRVQSAALGSAARADCSDARVLRRGRLRSGRPSSNVDHWLARVGLQLAQEDHSKELDGVEPPTVASRGYPRGPRVRIRP
jgi:hypothetical protein